jgi:hypothetical protein
MLIAVDQLLTLEINRPAHLIDRQLSITNPETRSNSF